MDPHPDVSSAADAIVGVVNRRAARLRALEEAKRAAIGSDGGDTAASLLVAEEDERPGSGGPLDPTLGLPQSGFYEWKKDAYAYDEDPTDASCVGSLWLDEGPGELDPLSPEGARRAYREKKNARKEEIAKELAAKYAHLAPRAGGGLEGDSAEWEDGREEVSFSESRRQFQ